VTAKWHIRLWTKPSMGSLVWNVVHLLVIHTKAIKILYICALVKITQKHVNVTSF
jgi:hypothetical protein